MHMPRFIFPLGLIVALGAMPSTSLAANHGGYMLPTTKKECGQFKRAFKSQWAAETAAHNKSLAKLQRQGAAATAKITKLQATNTQITAQIAGLQTQYDALQNTLDTQYAPP